MCTCYRRSYACHVIINNCHPSKYINQFLLSKCGAIFEFSMGRRAQKLNFNSYLLLATQRKLYTMKTINILPR